MLLYGLIWRDVRQLQQKHQLLQNIINSTSDAIFVKDLQGRYVVVNKMAAQLLGVHPTMGILGKVVEQFLSPEEVQRIRSFDSWDHLLTFMLEDLELDIPPNTS